jgi:hypothetical protein
MPVGIIVPQKGPSTLDKIAKGVQIAEGILGTVKGVGDISRAGDAADAAKAEEERKAAAFGQGQEAQARLNSPDSPESKAYKAQAQSYLGILASSELGKKNPDAFGPLVKLVSDPNTTGLQVKQAIDESPLLKYTNALATKGEGASLAAAVWGNRKEMQVDRQDQRAHQKTLDKLKGDPQLAKRLGNYTNLENALANITNAQSLTPQQIHEFQQTVRNSLGIGAGGVGEREETYIKSLGMDAANWRQFLTGDPAQISKDSKLIHHFQDLAKIEQKNIGRQMDKRINVLTAGNKSVYERRPDLKDDLMDAVAALKDQISDERQTQTAGAAGDGLPGMSSASASERDHTTSRRGDVVPGVSHDDIQAELAKRAAAKGTKK